MLQRVLILFLLTIVPAQARPWQFSDYAAVRTITDVRIAPNGASVLVAFSRPDLRRNAYVTQYERVFTTSAPPVPIAADLTNPRWAPDGTTIAWLASSKPDAIVLTDANGKAVRELRLGGPVVAFSWSPNGRQLAAVETRPVDGADARLRLMTTEGDLFGDLPPARSIWIVDVNSGRERRLTNDGWSYGGPSTDYDPSWSADGRELAVVRQPDSLNGSYEHAQYVTIDLRTGTARPVVHGAFFAYPHAPPPIFSPAGGALAYAKTWDGTLAAREDVYIDGRDVDASLDRDLWSCGSGALAWDQTHLVALLMDGVSMRLFRIDGDAAPRALTPRDGSVEGFSVAATGRITYIWSTPTRESAVELLDPNGVRREIVTPPQLPTGLTMPPTRLVQWTNGAGHILSGQLTLPDSSDLRRVPLVVEVHGGPQCSDDYSFQNFDVPLAQIYASHGFAYFRPNPRGSDGYGDWSYKAIVRDWGVGPMRDVMSGIDAVYRSGVGDPSRTFIEGGSYGGYLSAWIVTHTSRFRAAVVEIPATDLTMDAALGDSPNIDRRFFGPEPLLRDTLLAQQSPASYVDDMNTPLLLIAGAKDDNVSDAQAIVFYKLLAARGKPVKMLLDAQAGHWPSDPVGNNLWWRAAFEWFEAHL